VPGAPRIRIKAIAIMAGIDVKANTRRRPALQHPPAPHFPPPAPPQPPSLPR
jgi:hypothetical protein